MAELAAARTASGLSTMLGRPIRMAVPRLELVPIAQVADYVGGPEQEAVGIYLAISGDLAGHIMLILPLSDAMRLTDMLMEVPEGTTASLGPIERSALAEVGNVSASLFMSAIANASGLSAWPSPPAVMIDMVGAILDVILIGCGAVSDEILLLQTQFEGPDRSIEIYFWLVPGATIAAEG
jgi:chemotaxis protein CheC